MIPFKRIQRLWEACPELRPEDMQTHSVALSGFRSNATPEYGDGEMPESYAHAIIRDKIDDLLICRYGSSMRLHMYYKCGLFSIEADEWGDYPAIGVQMDDKTEARIEAAEQSLGLPEWKDA